MKLLAETFNMNRSCIIAFKNKPYTPVKLISDEFYSSVHQSKPSKPLRRIPQVGQIQIRSIKWSLWYLLIDSISTYFRYMIVKLYFIWFFFLLLLFFWLDRMWQTPERTLDAPDIIDDFCLNLMDWGNNNVLALALQNPVYFWNASNGSALELVTIDDDSEPAFFTWVPTQSVILVFICEKLVLEKSRSRHLFYFILKGK